MRFYELKKEILSYNPNAKIGLIERAFKFAKMMHLGQKRTSGEDYFTHPYEVAKILIKLKARSETIAAALLHDVVEECDVGLSVIKKEFGKDVANLVEGVTKIDKVHFNSREDYTATNLRKIILATAKDFRVMLIKLADRLHNMRTLKYFRPEKQKRIARETLEIYTPIAHKLGIWTLKGELEDLCLRYLEPEIYKMLKEKINEKRAQREKRTLEFIKLLKTRLKEKGIDAEVYGRAKYFFSIYKKMKKKNIGFDEIYDLFALRVITKSIADCYAALGVVHDIWKPIPKRFKDYIATPKLNGYQSLHTAVMGSHKKIIEVQIRTEEMHQFAEYGVAAHWRYHGTERDKKFEQKIAWLKQVLDWRSTAKDAHDFIESLKIDLFENEIVVFTPKGDPISLRKGATPVDFAYEVHTNIGNHCEKAYVNNKLVPLDSVLKSGDIIEIITSKNAKPSRQWLKFVKTGKARNKIRGALNIKADKKPKQAQDEPSESLAAKIIITDDKLKQKKAVLKISKCCSPKPGDKIIAGITKDKKITVHKKGCPNIASLDRNKIISVRWKQQKEELSEIRVVTKDKVGILAKVLNVFAQHKINIKSLNTKSSKETVVINVMIEPVESYIKSELANNIRNLDGVVDVMVIR